MSIWFISDTHFNHKNILKFKDKNGNLFRGNRFATISHMNETIIKNWNDVVGKNDKIYHLGDVFFGSNNEGENVLKRLNGNKILILGNHDKINIHSPLIKYFSKILLWWPYNDIIFSHIPLLKNQMLNRFNKKCINVHGHIHEKTMNNPMYYNVSVEALNYKPISLDQIIDYKNKILG